MQFLAGLLNESKDKKHEYGCVMLFFKFHELFKIQDGINPKDIYEDPEDDSYGLEDEPHCTLLYGLHEGVQIEDIKSVLDNHTYSTIKASNISLFENPKYDVLKFDVRYPTKEGAFLHKTNKDLKQFPYTNEYPDYHPHITIGYLKPGEGKKYVEMFKEQEYDLLPQYAVYSQTNGDQDKIKIKLK